MDLPENTSIRGDWLALFNLVNEVDPLTCPTCQERMKIISFIEDPEAIKKILKHLASWYMKLRPMLHLNSLHNGLTTQTLSSPPAIIYRWVSSILKIFLSIFLK